MEQWRDVVGYVGLYEVSDWGRVRSMDRVVPGRRGSMRLRGQILSPSPRNRYGHLAVRLYKNGVDTSFYVHHLVLEAWVGPRPKGLLALHGPSGVTDNSVGNLYYGTYSRNDFDKERDGTRWCRPVRRSDGVEYPSMRKAAEETGVSGGHISDVCRSRRKTTGGFGWEYI